MAQVGPRKIVAPQNPKQAALESLSRDLDLLNRQRDVLGRIVQEMLQGYYHVAQRVKASGDETLALASLSHLYRLARVYQQMKQLPPLSGVESTAMRDEEEILSKMADRLHVTSTRVASMRKKLALDFKVLQVLQQELGKISDLEVDSKSFFRTVGRAEVARREAKAKK